MAPELVARFARDLDALVEPAARLGVAVSGGPDSIALLLLAAAARPGEVSAATVDHRLRPESAAEAAMVAELCAELGVTHDILPVEWEAPPVTAIQERAREARYGLLAAWAQARQVTVLLTAHHRDDQAETLLMRLIRGAGVKGLAGIRPLSNVPGSKLALVRPLLGWTKAELERVCDLAGIEPVRDPSNEDARFERASLRQTIAEQAWVDRDALARSARHLAEADEALDWAVDLQWRRAVTEGPASIVYRPGDSPSEIRRRVARRAVLRLATEGDRETLRGEELDRLLAELADGRKTTLRGVLCSGGAEWRFVPAPHRTRPPNNSR